MVWVGIRVRDWLGGWAGVEGIWWGSQREGRLELEGSAGVGGEGGAEAVDLGFGLGHGPGGNAAFNDAHVPDKEVTGVGVEFGVG